MSNERDDEGDFQSEFMVFIGEVLNGLKVGEKSDEVEFKLGESVINCHITKLSENYFEISS